MDQTVHGGLAPPEGVCSFPKTRHGSLGHLRRYSQLCSADEFRPDGGSRQTRLAGKDTIPDQVLRRPVPVHLLEMAVDLTPSQAPFFLNQMKQARLDGGHLQMVARGILVTDHVAHVCMLGHSYRQHEVHHGRQRSEEMVCHPVCQFDLCAG